MLEETKGLQESFAMQKRWIAEDVRCTTNEQISDWDANELTWKNPCATGRMNHWTNESMHEWIRGSLKHWVNESTIPWIRASISESMIQLMSRWFNQWVNQCMCGLVSRRIDEPMKKWTCDQWVDESMSQWINEFNKSMNQWIDDSTSRWVSKCMNQ